MLDHKEKADIVRAAEVVAKSPGLARAIKDLLRAAPTHLQTEIYTDAFWEALLIELESTEGLK